MLILLDDNFSIGNMHQSSYCWSRFRRKWTAVDGGDRDVGDAADVVVLGVAAIEMVVAGGWFLFNFFLSRTVTKHNITNKWTKKKMKN